MNICYIFSAHLKLRLNRTNTTYTLHEYLHMFMNTSVTKVNICFWFLCLGYFHFCKMYGSFHCYYLYPITSISTIIIFTFFTLHMDALNKFWWSNIEHKSNSKVILSRISYLTVRKMIVLEEREEEKDSGDDESLDSVLNSRESTVNAKDGRWGPRRTSID